MATEPTVMMERAVWNCLLTGRPQGDVGEPDYDHDGDDFYDYYLWPDQFAEIEAERGEPLTEEYKAACVKLDEIVNLVENANNNDSLTVAIGQSDFDALRELARVADETKGLWLAHLLEDTL